MSLNFYFDETKKRLDIERDAALARRIGITPQELCRARSKGWLPDDALTKLSDISGISVETLLLAREATKEGKFQPIWTKALERAQHAAALLVMAVLAFAVTRETGGFEGAEMAFGLIAGIKITGNIRCVNMNLRSCHPQSP